MIVKRTYKYKLYRSKQIRKLEYLLSIACIIYNHCIVLQKRYYKLFKKNISENQLKKFVTKLKKIDRFSYWNQLNSQVIQDIIERIMRSYKSFFSNRRKNKKAKLPHFRKLETYKSITYKQSGYEIIDNVVKLQKSFRIKFCKSREIEGVIKTITFKRNMLDDWYMFVVCDVEVNEVLFRKGETIGLDFGLKHFLTTNMGKRIETPLFFKEMRNKIRKLNKSRSRKQGERKGEVKSKNWLKANYKLQKAYERLVNLRDNKQWELACDLCSKYAVICIEDLELKGMQKLWGRKICDLRFGEFIKKLEYVASKVGTTVIKVGKWFASSQICSSCGYKYEEVRNLRLRKWKCPHCGQEHDRDVNSAKNILAEGLRILETT